MTDGGDAAAVVIDNCYGTIPFGMTVGIVVTCIVR